jgi:hypothetical protein
MRYVVFIAIFLPFLVTGQMLLNSDGQVLEDMPFFNPQFIRNQSVKSFRGSYATKYDHDVIRPNDDAFVYEFDKLGQLVRKYKIHMGDTLLSTYIYDYKGNVLIHRETNKFGYHEKRYRYDKLNRVTELEIRRDNGSVANKLSFELEKKHTVAIEKYEYIPLDGNDYKKICYNSSGRVYRIEFYYFDKAQRLIKKESALHNGSGRSEINYFYNDQGYIEEVKKISKASKTHTNRKLFTYDKEGNVLSKMVYRNEKLINEQQLVYFEDSGLLKAILTREDEESKITILQFKQYRNF